MFPSIRGGIKSEARVQAILELRMPKRVKVVLVTLQGFWIAPGHVADQVFLATFNIAWLFGSLTSEADFLGDEPMPERMNVEIKLQDCTQSVPVFFEAVVIVGIPSA